MTGEPRDPLRVRDVTAIGARKGRLLACNGSKQFDVLSRESVELPRALPRAVHDGAEEFRGWSDRETLVLVGDEPGDLRLRSSTSGRSAAHKDART